MSALTCRSCGRELGTNDFCGECLYERGFQQCDLCNGYGSSLKEDAPKCSKCGGSGLVPRTRRGGQSTPYARVRFWIVPDADDDSQLPMFPWTVELTQVSETIELWLNRYHQQGYYKNCLMERIPLNQIAFRLEPEDKDSHGFLGVLAR